MMLRSVLAGLAFAVLANSAHAQAPAHAHTHDPAHAPGQASTADEAQVRAVVTAYKDAIERMDVSQTAALFWADSEIFENGGVEGSFAYYLEHHLGPEFADLAGFDFRNHETKVEVDGDTAFVSETYTYHITFKDSARAPIERRGAATSVLRKRGDEWRFDVYHSSARPFRPAA
ncbi:MAG: nuclear transport factor 2 family protein [Brevundimonas sp.]|uniref:YybH family protein n=1 Tax=Brevundimonas sp. TaxID=1871086 RepID=UPI00248706B2|nr:nuclear transport factor 2 family protein [Brevundimonas sp.]MDI1328221.1 nuclear transport factor 2 family protein [Brevundimonas sp.]